MRERVAYGSLSSVMITLVVCEFHLPAFCLRHLLLFSPTLCDLNLVVVFLGYLPEMFIHIVLSCKLYSRMMDQF